jgi:hypothetical protein
MWQYVAVQLHVARFAAERGPFIAGRSEDLDVRIIAWCAIPVGCRLVEILMMMQNDNGFALCYFWMPIGTELLFDCWSRPFVLLHPAILWVKHQLDADALLNARYALVHLEIALWDFDVTKTIRHAHTWRGGKLQAARGHTASAKFMQHPKYLDL